ncbi:ADP-ribosylglycohydrolase family protein [Fonticella tunisiensis]|uniref:ADP-ribosylglycohydrolase n=1 Tax=Fonticella tunisiensis TaxID=1096341 RepID=A0A4R7KST2_9CLOT|nr:ADP-ribosylglycohydrolase family protein [Fonticella tunisiensis]TDT62866.1 ADP-ribosylglycohydrolase [Fonticella tunisiensis]
MLGAIAGDIIGSVFEWNNNRSKDFPLFSSGSDFTDDTVMTIATADVLLHHGDYAKAYKKFGRLYPGRGYGGRFAWWLGSESYEPYNSFGNGSAMRVSPVGFAFDTLEKVLEEAKKSAEVTHNHPEGIKGAQATAAAIFLARTGKSKEDIKTYIEKEFQYDLSRRLDDIRPTYEFNGTCQGSVPEAIIAFLESEDFEDAIRNAISIGGDSDTIACIAGGIAEAYYGGVPGEIKERVMEILDERMRGIVEEFRSKVLKE